jgi:hypothetical protein
VVPLHRGSGGRNHMQVDQPSNQDNTGAGLSAAPLQARAGHRPAERSCWAGKADRSEVQAFFWPRMECFGDLVDARWYSPNGGCAWQGLSGLRPASQPRSVRSGAGASPSKTPCLIRRACSRMDECLIDPCRSAARRSADLRPERSAAVAGAPRLLRAHRSPSRSVAQRGAAQPPP